ncbi:MAG: DUF327 family protein [Spirochaetes bacterium]|nr:DUF327 family protein [Spirochaetota bacterium]
MRISSAYTKEREKLKSRGKDREIHASESSSFSKIFEITADNAFSQTIDEFMNDLQDHEKKFLDTQSLFELNRYRSKVKEILAYIIKNSMQTSSLQRKRSSRKADFLIIKEIDSKLLDLTKTISGSGNKAFNLLKTIEEIRGLIFDLTY